MRTVLIIDDHAGVGEALSLLLSLHDIEALYAASPAEGLAVLARRRVDLVIQDMNFSADTTSGEEGRALFQQLRERHPDLPIILLTAWTQLEQAVALVKAGAADYLAKPWDDAKLLATVENLLELAENGRALRESRHEQRQRREELRRRYRFDGLVFESPALLRCLDAVAALKAEGDEAVGIAIIRRSLEEPLRQIAANAGHEGAVVVTQVLELTGDVGFNAQTEAFENLVEAGVIDPTKVVRSALQNAASIASLLLSTEAVICELPNEKADGRAGGGMSPDGGMY